MIQSNSQWQMMSSDEALIQSFCDALHIPPLLAKILVARDIQTVEEAKQFIEMDHTALHDPFMMYQMDEAVETIQFAIDSQVPILIYGDYDADGVTSTTVLLRALQSLGALVDYAIPNRFKHGYGPNAELFEEKIHEGFELIITVDNGISGHDAIAHAQNLGATVIVTDHHEIGETLPPADCIIHPRHPEGNYPFPELAGVGVAFKLATALLGGVDETLLPYVAIGTIADLVPLVDENRYIVKRGLSLLQKSEDIGLRALAEASKTPLFEADEETVGFSYGPRLNAPGRLQEATLAVQLLNAETAAEASSYAMQLNEMNVDRQQMVQTITEEAEQMMQAYTEVPEVIVLAKEGWNPGVVGIVASRITDKYYRPTIILGIDSETGEAKGSARSIEGYHLYEALKQSEPIVEKYGGHAMAAGLTIPIEQIEPLRERLIAIARETLTPEDYIPKLTIDVQTTIDEIDLDVLDDMKKLRPFGIGFPKPTYMIENVKVLEMRKIGSALNHLKMKVGTTTDALDCIGFQFGEVADELTVGTTVSLAGDIQINEWNGRRNPQFMLEDLQSKDVQVFDMRGIEQLQQWLPKVAPNATFILFQPQHAERFAKHVPLTMAEDLTGEEKVLVFLDLPDNMAQLTTIIERHEPHRLYCHFYVAQTYYMERIPTREMFGWLFQAIKQRGHLDFVKEWQWIAKQKGWKKDTIVFMLKVFLDLKFVTLEGSVFTIAPNIEKRNLEEAPTYQQRERQISLERDLLYSSYNQLKQTLLQ